MTRMYAPVGNGVSFSLEYRFHFRSRSYGFEKFSSLYCVRRAAFDCEPDDPVDTPIPGRGGASCGRDIYDAKKRGVYPTALVPRCGLLVDHGEPQPLVRVSAHQEEQQRAASVGWTRGGDVALWARLLRSPLVPPTLTPSTVAATAANASGTSPSISPMVGGSHLLWVRWAHRLLSTVGRPFLVPYVSVDVSVHLARMAQ